MCGRYTSDADQAAWAEYCEMLGVPVTAAPAPRFNIAPGQPVVIVRKNAGSRVPELAGVQWGLVPSWAKDPKIGNKLINARSETAAVKPSFKAASRERRCLVPASGFYEWGSGTGGRKQPYLFRLKGAALFSMAGLWERWVGPEGKELETCTILTTEANDLLKPVHDRMPVILPMEASLAWLDEKAPPGALQQPLVPLPASRMTHVPVSPWVNDPRHEDSRCVERAPNA